MRCRFLALALLLLVNDASAQQPSLDPAAQLAAKRYYDCLHRAAELLDDLRSDAASIGVGVAAACQVERRALAVATSKGNFQLQQMMEQCLEEKSVGSATSFVLAVRKYRANNPHGTPARPKPKSKGEAI